MIDPETAALFISVLPVFLVLALFMVKKHKKRETLFFLGFLSITTFYIVAPDPSTIEALYTSQGNYSFPMVVAVVSFIFLAIAAFAFGKYTGASPSNAL